MGVFVYDTICVMAKAIPHNIILLGVLLLILIAFVANFYRYEVRLDYKLLFSGACDPAVTTCVFDESDYYAKYLVPVTVIESKCGSMEADECTEYLIEQNDAVLIECENNLADWESCVGPDTYVPTDEEASSTIDE